MTTFLSRPRKGNRSHSLTIEALAHIGSRVQDPIELHQRLVALSRNALAGAREREAPLGIGSRRDTGRKGFGRRKRSASGIGIACALLDFGANREDDAKAFRIGNRA